MATVPRDGFDAALAPASLGRQESIASPDLFDAGARKDMETGAQLADAGTKLNTVAIKLQQQDNLTAVQAANVKYQDAAQKFQMDAREKRTLNGAAGVTADFDQFHEKLTKEIRDTLGNDAQQRAFEVMAGKSRLAIRHDLGTFEIGEGKKAYAATTDAAVSQAINSAASAVTDDAARVFIGNAVNSAKAYAAVNNYSDAQRDDYVGKVLTNAHKQRIEDLTVRDPGRAAEYFKSVEKEIDGAQRAEIGAKAIKATSEEKGDAAAEATWAKYRPASANEPFKFEQAANELRASLKDLPAAVRSVAEKKGLGELQQRYAEYANEVKQTNAKNMVEVITAIRSGQPYQNLPAFKALDDDSLMKVDTYAENRKYTLAARGAAEENRAYTKEARAEAQRVRTGDATVYQLTSHPEVLMAMSQPEVAALEATIGHDPTYKLLDFRKKLLTTPEKVFEAKLDIDMFKREANVYGIPVFHPNPTEEQRMQIGNAHAAVEQRLTAEAAARKRDLTPAEKLQFTRETLDNKVIQSSFWGNDTVSMAALAGPARQEAYVKTYLKAEGGEPAKNVKVQIKDIPDDLYAAGRAAARSKGLQGTEQQIINELAESYEGKRFLRKYGTWRGIR